MQTLTGGAGAMGVRTGVGRRAVAPQACVAFTAVGLGQGDGTPNLTVGTGRGAEGTSARNEPAPYWNKGTI